MSSLFAVFQLVAGRRPLGCMAASRCNPYLVPVHLSAFKQQFVCSGKKKHGGGFDELNIVRDDAELRTRISPIGTANEFEVEAHG